MHYSGSHRAMHGCLCLLVLVLNVTPKWLSAEPNVPLYEVSALHDLYYATNGDLWSWNKDGSKWNFTSANPCADSWQGITCQTNSTGGLYVHSIELSVFNLRGYLPSSLGNLSVLQSLRMESNVLQGTIPTSFGLLSILADLRLDANSLTGSIPSSLGGCTRLRYLSLGNNLLTGSVPESIAQVTELTNLVLSVNFLSGTIPASLGQLTNAMQLYLQHNRLTGTIPAALGNCVHLRELSLRDNQLSGPIPGSLGQLMQLSDAFLYNNFLTGPLPAALFASEMISRVVIDNNQLTGTLPTVAFTGTSQSLALLVCSNNRLTGTIPDLETTALSLQVLDLSGNHLSGPITQRFIDSVDSLRYLGLETNDLTGVLPQDWSALQHTLVYLFLSSNRLAGPIPPSLGGLTILLSVELASNHFTGTLSAQLSQPRDLQVLMVQDNRLVGSLDAVFDATRQRNITTVQLSGNQFTGTLPGALFRVPTLAVFAAVDNCLTGPLPVEAICASTALSSLVLDGLHAARSCNHRSVLSHKTFSLGTLSACLLTMPTLTTLHLSGGGLTGSLPEVPAISAALVDLSLAHNLLTGRIPRVFLRQRWESLDLSYNHFTGTLQSADRPAYHNTTKLHLEHNHLSGRIPNSLKEVGGGGNGELSILVGNLFSCESDRSDLPAHDTNRDRYSCGSDAVNNPLYAWLGLVVVCVLAGIAFCTVYEHRGAWLRWWAVLSVRDSGANHSAQQLPHLRKVFAVFQTLAGLGAVAAAYSLMVLLPLYVSSDSTYTYQYAWTVGGIFLSGQTTFALEMVFLLLQLPLCNYLAERWLCAAKIAPNNEQEVMSFHWKTLGQQSVIYGSFLILNLVIVGGVNVGFVFATLGLEGAQLISIQVLLAVFKLGFTTIVMQDMERRITARLARGGVELVQGFANVRLAVALLNNIVIPCAVVMVISPTCFYDLLNGLERQTSSFQYSGSCAVPSFDADGNVFCLEVSVQTDTTSYTPPFSYSYHCSSSFVTYYAPTFVIMCIISAFLVPLQRLLFVTLRTRVAPNSSSYRLLSRYLPHRLDEPTAAGGGDADGERRIPHVVEASHILVLLWAYLAILLTFGLLFPPLAVCCALAMASIVATTRLEIGRYLTLAAEAGQDCLDEVESECAKESAPQQLRVALDLVLTLSCMFYTLFLFDTLGDAVGFADAYWLLILVPMLPFPALALRDGLSTMLQRRSDAVNPGAPGILFDAKGTDPEVGVELETHTKLSHAPGAVATSSVRVEQNPLHGR